MMYFSILRSAVVSVQRCHFIWNVGRATLCFTGKHSNTVNGKKECSEEVIPQVDNVRYREKNKPTKKVHKSVNRSTTLTTDDRQKIIESSLYVNSIISRDHKWSGTYPFDIRSSLSVKALMRAGAHFGHCPENWNKNMLPFIYGERNRIHIINLEHTLIELRRACAFLKHLRSVGGRILFIGKRKQLHTIVYDAAELSSSYYAFEWDPRITDSKAPLFNSLSYRSPYANLLSVIEKVLTGAKPAAISQDPEGQDNKSPLDKDEIISEHSFKVVGFKTHERMDRINVHYPDAVIVLDYMNCLDVIASSNRAAVPVVAICDTDCDPNAIQYAIPANDDSLNSVSLIAGVLSLAIREGAILYNSLDEETKLRYNPSGLSIP